MKRVFLSFVTIGVLLSSGHVAQAKNATLIIHNNTDATLTIYAQQIYGSEVTGNIQIPPVTKRILNDFLPRGTVRVHAYPTYNPSRVPAIWEQYIVSGDQPRNREWEIFPQSFDVTFLADPPGQDQQEGKITVLEATYGWNCRDHTPPVSKGKNTVEKGGQTASVGAACNGKESCTYIVDYKTIGDPAYGCMKEFDVIYQCGGGEQKTVLVPKEAGNKRQAALTCP